MDDEPTQKDISVSFDVGDNTGNLFIYGTQEAIDRVHQLVAENRRMRTKIQGLLDRMRALEQNDVNEGLIRHAAIRFREFEERRIENVLVIAQLITYVERNGGEQELLDRAKDCLLARVTDQEPDCLSEDTP